MSKGGEEKTWGWTRPNVAHMIRGRHLGKNIMLLLPFIKCRLRTSIVALMRLKIWKVLIIHIAQKISINCGRWLPLVPSASLNWKTKRISHSSKVEVVWSRSVRGNPVNAQASNARGHLRKRCWWDSMSPKQIGHNSKAPRPQWNKFFDVARPFLQSFHRKSFHFGMMFKFQRMRKKLTCIGFVMLQISICCC